MNKLSNISTQSTHRATASSRRCSNKLFAFFYFSLHTRTHTRTHRRTHAQRNFSKRSRSEKRNKTEKETIHTIWPCVFVFISWCRDIVPLSLSPSPSPSPLPLLLFISSLLIFLLSLYDFEWATPDKCSVANNIAALCKWMHSSDNEFLFFL